jgi:cob(I)alamin adenosyltransferase
VPAISRIISGKALMSDKKGIVMLFTGDGKGKTTAAVGAAVRAAGHGAEVLIIQFMKGRLYGELASLDKLDSITIEQYGRDEFVDPKEPEKIDVDLAAEGWARALDAVASGPPSLLVLDEINVVVSFGMIPVETVVDFVRERPAGMDLILTGRYAAQELIDISDTVTEMKEIKHHYGAGVQMRKGIEY